ncbi:MAG: di-trans,poly-cis-decaprenylcistransferase, partial [Lachnospiraceae bacterium]|nr:di-trans,poly-cis-decaprenylcistransferase [Lachnospiraceae bacterium]
MSEKSVPKHLAVILDGNGRWAKKRGLPRSAGHIQGARNVEDMCEWAWNHGIEYFTVYAFSTENWARPADEVKTLMKLLRDYMVGAVKRANANNMKVRIIGDKKGLDKDIQESIAALEDATKDNDGLKFTIAINYGSRDEIRRAVTKLCEKAAAGEIKADEITEEMIASQLDTAPYPDPDLLVRTSGEQRISNYLLWQCAYSEFYFTDVAWPDFKEAE